MKKILIVCLTSILLSSIWGCKSNKQEIKSKENGFESIDTILQRSEKNFDAVSRANKKTDSSISNKVEKTVNQITNLKQEVNKLKQENNELKIKINDANDVGKPFKLLPVSNGQDNR